MAKKQMKCGVCGELGHKRNNRYFHPVEGQEVKPKKEKKKKEGGVGGASLKNEDNFIHNFNTNTEFMNTFIEKDHLYSYHFFRLLQRAKNIYLLYNKKI